MIDPFRLFFLHARHFAGWISLGLGSTVVKTSLGPLVISPHFTKYFNCGTVEKKNDF